jgi:hypothetical protein
MENAADRVEAYAREMLLEEERQRQEIEDIVESARRLAEEVQGYPIAPPTLDETRRILENLAGRGSARLPESPSWTEPTPPFAQETPGLVDGP